MNNNASKPYISAPTKSDLSESLLKKAQTLHKKGAYTEAIKKYLNLILIKRNDAKLYYCLGSCYMKSGKTKKAIEYFEESAKLDCENFQTFYDLGLCHLKEETPCKAIKCFIQAIKIEPDNPDAILQLGIAHEMCDEEDMALMIYQKLIDNSPTYINAYLNK